LRIVRLRSDIGLGGNDSGVKLSESFDRRSELCDRLKSVICGFLGHLGETGDRIGIEDTHHARHSPKRKRGPGP
jgi:hypothetical protein